MVTDLGGLDVIAPLLAVLMAFACIPLVAAPEPARSFFRVPNQT
ncbi:hypothetical protein SAMN04487925_103687 [Bradyrhizobium sp. cf659]|nr:hypothetical protein SAMN04487925_103687 [Bradyrhizobium sp. cf659]